MDSPIDRPSTTDPSIASVVVSSLSPSGLRVLLLHPSDVDSHVGDWAWVPPGGQREPGEDPAACARRELEEETGIRADPDLVCSVTQDIQIGDKAIQVKVAVFHLDVPWQTSVQLSHEHTDSEWVTVDQVRERCRPLAVRDAVMSALIWAGHPA